MNEEQLRPLMTAAAAYVWWTIIRQALGIVLTIAFFALLICIAGTRQ